MSLRPVVAAFLVLLPTLLSAEEPLRVLLIDGQNNHNLTETTPYLKQMLEETGRFAVDVVSTPPKGAEESAWDGFRPQFDRYDAVLSNYNGETWPESVREAFEKYVSSGGGVVNVHAANNPFPDWDEWNRMIGLAWRPAAFGPRLVLDDDGEPVRMPPGEGQGAGHGPRYAFPIVVREPSHPVMEGLPREWMHASDELYHGQRGPAANMHVLATAFAAPEKKGTGYHEPMVWWIPYGEGRVFTTVMGHVSRNASLEDDPAMLCIGFRTIVRRGTEWAATGEVTLPVPEDFPTADQVRTADAP